MNKENELREIMEAHKERDTAKIVSLIISKKNKIPSKVRVLLFDLIVKHGKSEDAFHLLCHIKLLKKDEREVLHLVLMSGPNVFFWLAQTIAHANLHEKTRMSYIQLLISSCEDIEILEMVLDEAKIPSAYEEKIRVLIETIKEEQGEIPTLTLKHDKTGQ